MTAESASTSPDHTLGGSPIFSTTAVRRPFVLDHPRSDGLSFNRPSEDALCFNLLVKFYELRHFGVKGTRWRRPQRRQDEIGHMGEARAARSRCEQVTSENNAECRAVGLVEIGQARN